MGIFDPNIFDPLVFDVEVVVTGSTLALNTSEDEDSVIAALVISSPNTYDIEPLIIYWSKRETVIEVTQRVFTVPPSTGVIYVPKEYDRVRLPGRNRPNPGTFNPDTSDVDLGELPAAVVVADISEAEDIIMVTA